MASTYKVLGQAAPANTSNADLFTVPAGHTYVVSTLNIANTTATAATCRVFARIAGAAAATSNALMYDVSMTANSVNQLTMGATFAATDILTIQTGTANALTFTAFGSDNS